MEWAGLRAGDEASGVLVLSAGSVLVLLGTKADCMVTLGMWDGEPVPACMLDETGARRGLHRV